VIKAINIGAINDYLDEMLHNSDQQGVELKACRKEIKRLEKELRHVGKRLVASQKLVSKLEQCPHCGCNEMLCGYNSNNNRGCSSKEEKD
jgi:hypothetical protein